MRLWNLSTIGSVPPGRPKERLPICVGRAATRRGPRARRGGSLRVSTRLLAGGLEVGVAEDVGDEREVATVLAPAGAWRRCIAGRARTPRCPTRAITEGHHLLIERTEICLPGARDTHARAAPTPPRESASGAEPPEHPQHPPVARSTTTVEVETGVSLCATPGIHSAETGRSAVKGSPPPGRTRRDTDPFTAIPCNMPPSSPQRRIRWGKPTPGLEPGTPSLRVKCSTS